jgi:hypothetical protein
MATTPTLTPTTSTSVAEPTSTSMTSTTTTSIDPTSPSSPQSVSSPSSVLSTHGQPALISLSSGDQQTALLNKAALLLGMADKLGSVDPGMYMHMYMYLSMYSQCMQCHDMRCGIDVTLCRAPSAIGR